jgi:hypothetical protein
MIEQPYSGRAIITDNFNELTLIIPSKKKWPITIFYCFWLCAWAFALIMVFKIFLRGPGPAVAFIAIWLIGWITGGLFIANQVVWALFGKEIVTVGNGILSIRKTGTIFRKTKSYDLAHIANVYAKEESVYTRRNSFRELNNRGTINFDYGMKTIRFGELDEAEARHIIGLLKAKKYIQ